MAELQPQVGKEALLDEKLLAGLAINGVLTAVGLGLMVARWSWQITLAGWALSLVSAAATAYLYRKHIFALLRLKLSIEQLFCIFLVSIDIVLPFTIYFSDPSRATAPLLRAVDGIWGDASCANTLRISTTLTALSITPIKYPAGAKADPITATITGTGPATVNTEDVRQSGSGTFSGARFTLHDNGRAKTLEWDDFHNPPRYLSRCG